MKKCSEHIQNTCLQMVAVVVDLTTLLLGALSDPPWAAHPGQRGK